MTRNYYLYTFFWVFPRRLNELRRRFGTLCQVHLQRLMKNMNNEKGAWYLCMPCPGWQGQWPNVGTIHSDAGEIPKRKYTRFRTRRKFEINKLLRLYCMKSANSFSTRRRRLCILYHRASRYGYLYFIAAGRRFLFVWRRRQQQQQQQQMFKQL
jgi:hypothetical protein